MASIVLRTPKIGLTPYQLRILAVIRSRGGSHTGHQLEGDCVKRPGLSSKDAKWRKSRSVFYSNLRRLCKEGKIEKFALVHYVGMKNDPVGYRIKEEATGPRESPY